MSEPVITCPNCNHEIKLTESLAAPLLAATRREYEAKLNAKDHEIEQQEQRLEAQRTALAQERRDLEKTVSQRSEEARKDIAAQEAERATLFMKGELDERDRSITDLQTLLEKQNTKLANAQQAHAEMLRKQRELDEQKQELELTVEKRVRAGLADATTKGKLQAEEAMQLRVREKEEQIAAMSRQIEDLKRRAEQGSQQLQGEVQELELERALSARFPQDRFEPVPKGINGADLLHHVFNAAGQSCGTIILETKRTKAWSDGWLAKLRADQRAAKADLALIVSHATPKAMATSFDLVDGVWVTEPKCAIPVALCLRESLVALAGTRLASDGQQTKAELVYAYLTGPRFRQRVETIIEQFSAMKDDLERERRVMTKQWAKRESQIITVVETTAGLYGDLQGIAGKNLQEIEALDLALLEGPTNALEHEPA